MAKEEIEEEEEDDDGHEGNTEDYAAWKRVIFLEGGSGPIPPCFSRGAPPPEPPHSVSWSGGLSAPPSPEPLPNRPETLDAAIGRALIDVHRTRGLHANLTVRLGHARCFCLQG